MLRAVQATASANSCRCSRNFIRGLLGTHRKSAPRHIDRLRQGMVVEPGDSERPAQSGSTAAEPTAGTGSGQSAGPAMVRAACGATAASGAADSEAGCDAGSEAGSEAANWAALFLDPPVI